MHVALHPTLWQVHASTMDVQPPTIPLLTHVLGVHEHARPAAWHSNWLRNCPQSNGDEKSLQITRHPSPQLDSHGSGMPAQPTSHVQPGGDTHWLYPALNPHTGDDPEHPSACNRHPAASQVPVPCPLHPGSGTHAVRHPTGGMEDEPPALEDGAGGPLLLESTEDDDEALEEEEEAASDVDPATDEDDAREDDPGGGVDELCRPLLDATRDEEPGRDADELPGWEDPPRLEDDPATDEPDAPDTRPPLELLAPAVWHVPSSHTAPGSQSALFWQVVFTEQPHRPPAANATTTQPTRVCLKTTPPSRQHSAPVVMAAPCMRVSSPRRQKTCP